MTADELYDRIEWLATATSVGAVEEMYMHETLVLACHEGLKDSKEAFGSLFAQVDHLCRKHHLSVADTIAVQGVRKQSTSGSNKDYDHTSWLYRCRALAIFVSAVMDTDVPSRVVARIPVTGEPKPKARHIDYRAVRAVVNGTADTASAMLEVHLENGEERTVRLDADTLYILRIVREGMTLSLVDVHIEDDGTLSPRFVIIEPDYLLDISSLARCFTDHGHHPFEYLLNHLSPSANSQAILLGNYAGDVLDNLLRAEGSAHEDDNEEVTDTSDVWKDTLKHHFTEEALEYATCPDFDAKEYKQQCQAQAKNIEGIIKEIRHQGYDDHILLEPTFLCPDLGIQGRVDMMSSDMGLLVEQKSGKNNNLEKKIRSHHGVYQKEDHYVQLLLYYAVLHQNFGIPFGKTDIRLMYSRYPLPDGLLVVAYYQKLLKEAFMVRNRIVASEMFFAREGFTPRMLRALTPETLNEQKKNDRFYQQYIRPRHEELLTPLHHLTPLEEAYFCRMMSFIYREQAISRIGAQEGTTHGMADLWNMPVEEKEVQGEIAYIEISEEEECHRDNEIFTFRLVGVTDNGLNFRAGDSVLLYSKKEDKRKKGDGIPATQSGCRGAFLFKGTIVSLSAESVKVQLMDPQPRTLFENRRTWVMEHSHSSSGTYAAMRAMYMLVTAPKERRELLLGLRKPEYDETVTLTASYHKNYDDVLLRVKQAKDYHLLVGPPGTGKTSMAMRFMIQEHLKDGHTILLTSFTNRAIDEICEMLEDAGIDYLRIGGKYSCAEEHRSHLASEVFAAMGNLTDIRKYINDVSVVVATTSTLMAHQQILDMKQFSLTIVDEASQILEPNIIGLLSRLGKFVLIGDHKQLPAVVQQSEADSAVNDPLLLEIGLTNCRNSLFERLINTAPLASSTLHYHGRMHPDIAAWPSRMFYAKERLQPVMLPHQTEEHLAYNGEATDELDQLLNEHRMLFLDVRNKDAEGMNLDVKSNIAEARACADVVVRLMRLGEVETSDIGIIVPYRNQISMIRREIEKRLTETDRRSGESPEQLARNITIDTVERYQGSQRDVIIYSFTVSQRYQLEFLTQSTFMDHDTPIDRKLNVALTRARKQMILIGNKDLLCSVPLLLQLISDNTQFVVPL